MVLEAQQLQHNDNEACGEEVKLLNSKLPMIVMQPKRKLFDDPELDSLVKEIRRRHIAEKIRLK